MKNPFRIVYDFFVDLIDLKGELDVEGTIYEIRNNKTMKGANAWMLMCSIVIASLGLDLNSPAIIIGAMLISPLMSPILGIGLGVGIADMDTIKKALAHFGIAIFIALFVATTYFYFSPLGDLTDQIFYRTQPTLLDVMVAFFGGIAGIVSSSRKDKTNAIPGVAIATALMPPLCVSGFGIANGNMEIMLNSFYLFFLNSFFVALATYLMVRYLNFPKVKAMDRKSKNRAIAIVTLVSVLLIVPSILILRKLYFKQELKENTEQFIAEYFKDRNSYIDSWTMIEGTPNRLMLKVYGNEINYSDTSNCKEAMIAAGLFDTKLQILPTSEIDLDKFEKLEAQVTGIKRINEKFEEIQSVKTKQDDRIDSLIHTIQILQSDSLLFRKIREEIHALFPSIEYFALGQADVTDFSENGETKKIAIVKWAKKIRSTEVENQKLQILNYLKLRTGEHSLDVIIKTQD